MAEPQFPESYKDPTYAALDTATEQKLGIYPGLLASVRTNGERSNHSQTNDLGTATVYQFTPTTRKLILDKYGLDVTLSAANASEGAGLLLQEGLKRNGGDPAQAVGEYIGGIDRANWGKTTRSYINRVMVGLQKEQPAQLPANASTFDRVQASMQPAIPPDAIARVLQAYQSGQMTPQERSDFESDVKAGKVMLPKGESLQAADPAATTTAGNVLPQGVLNAYYDGKMTPQEKAQLQSDVASGLVKLPKGVQLEAGGTLAGSARASQIPGQDGQPVVQPATPEPSLGQKIIGAGEAGLSTLTGLTGGTLGTVGGFVGGLAGAVLNGDFGTPEAAQRIEQGAAEGGQALTFAPRSASGQSQTEAIGNAIGQTIPAAAVLHTIPMTARPAMDMVVKPAQDAKTAALQAVKEKVMAAAARRQAANDPSAAAAGTGTFGPDSIGAARVGDAQVRRSAAEDLGMTGDAALTKGQAERTFEQQRFEQEMAKDPQKGTAIRERAANQNARMWGNFDQWLDQTGAQKVQPGEVGDAVKEALIQRSQADINRTRVAYAKADNSPEANAMVDPGQKVAIGEGEQALTSSPIDFLNSKPSGLATTALADHARQYALKLGVAEKGANGDLVSVASPIRVMEEWRKEINAATDSTDPVQVRDATILKKMIDAQTEPVAGPLYQQARMLRSQYAQRYENVGLVYDLMNNKPGMADAKVAAEDVFRRAILNGKMDEIKHLGRILKAGGDRGRQAWAELQGATVRYIRDEAARNITRNERGEEMVSAKGLDSSITSLDRAGKLDYLFGKQGAEKLRALNDLAKVLFTSPPGAVNHSNTASVILAALDMATSGMAGIPAPIFSGLRILTTHVKDRQIQKRINEALGIRPQPKVKAPASAPHRPIPPARAPENRTVH